MEQSLSPNNSKQSMERMFYKDKRREQPFLDDGGRLEYQEGKGRQDFGGFSRMN